MSGESFCWRGNRDKRKMGKEGDSWTFGGTTLMLTASWAMLCSLQIPENSTATKTIRNLSNPSLAQTDGRENVQGTTGEDLTKPRHHVLPFQDLAFPKRSSTSHPTADKQTQSSPRPTESTSRASHLLRWTRFGVYLAVPWCTGLGRGASLWQHRFL